MPQQPLSTKLGISFQSPDQSPSGTSASKLLSSSMDASGNIWYVGMVYRWASTSEIEAELMCGQSIKSYY
jgi:hypothetical protein